MRKGLVNQRVAAIAPSVSLGIDTKAKALAAQGVRVCNFSAGEPDVDTPEFIKEAAIRALRDGKTKYTPAAGLPQLREAVAAKLQQENRLPYTASQVIICNGAKHALFNVFMALVRDGDDVLLPAPYWLSYPEMIRVAGGRTVIIPGREDNGFKITPEDLAAAVTPQSKALVLNSPCNPSGIVYTGEELRALAEVAVEQGLYIISDEIYENIVYDGAEHVSPGSFSPEIFAATITVNGFSKAFSMTGWRLGYVAAPDFLTKAMTALQSHATSGPNTFAQYGALASLGGKDDSQAAMLKTFGERRRFLLDRCESIRGVSCVPPLGAFYLLPNIARFGLDSVTFAERFLTEHNVAVIPGVSFGAPEHVRISYACGLDVLKEGMDRLQAFVSSL